MVPLLAPGPPKPDAAAGAMLAATYFPKELWELTVVCGEAGAEKHRAIFMRWNGRSNAIHYHHKPKPLVQFTRATPNAQVRRRMVYMSQHRGFFEKELARLEARWGRVDVV